jgi:hypothetical protein
VILADVNVLVGAFRADAPEHAICRPWLNRTVDGPENFGVSRLVLSAVVRVTTNTRSFTTASSLDDAFGFCADIMENPRCQMVEPGERHWDIFKRLCIETRTRGPRVTDAWFAALAIEWECEWISLDRDFARFPGLRWSRPAAA